MSTDGELAAALREQRALREAADRKAQAIAERAYAEKDPGLSDEEIAARCGRSREWVRSWRRRTVWRVAEAMRLYHGGAAGLRVGAMLTAGHGRDERHPGCQICAARASGASTIDPASARHAVYVTTDKEYARYYASLWGAGSLYRVAPLGAPVRSEEDLFPAWTVEAATVVEVLATDVRLTPTQRKRLYRRWAAREGVGPADADAELRAMVRAVQR